MQSHLDTLDLYQEESFEFVLAKSKVSPVQPKALGRPRRRNRFWAPLFRSIDSTYDTADKTLAKGALLYHGSLDDNPRFYDRIPDGKQAYFGLDFLISSWILVESFKSKYTSGWEERVAATRAFVHVYEVIDPISYVYLKGEHGVPIELDGGCGHGACVHPQVIYHDKDWITLQELGTELTIPKGSDLFQRIKHVKTFEMSLASLIMHQIHSVNRWKPHNAIRCSVRR